MSHSKPPSSTTTMDATTTASTTMVTNRGRRTFEDDSDDDYVGGGGRNPPRSRWASTTQESSLDPMNAAAPTTTTNTMSSAAEMLQSLQPVRDLAQNFDIDIATYLDEYLEKLVDALDEGHPVDDEGIGPHHATTTPSSLDFAQAALLVQNSSAVYGRKVDYFSTLVVKALEGFQSSVDAAGLSHPRGGGARNRAGGGGAGAAATDEDRAFWELLRDDNYDFLALDDVMPMAKPADITRGTAERLRRTRKNSIDRRTSLSRLSLSFHTHQSIPSLSQQQQSMSLNPEALAAASSSHLASSMLDHLDLGRPGGGGTNDEDSLPYRVPKYHSLNLVGSKCEITSNGALLLPGVADASTMFRGRKKLPVVIQGSVEGNNDDDDAAPSSPGTSKAKQGEPTGDGLHQHDDNDDDGPDFPAAMDDDDDDDDHDNSGPGFSFGGNNDENVAVQPRQPQPVRAGVLRTAQNPTNLVKTSVTFDDPWELLDPHQPVGNHRPMKKGMTLAVPHGLSDLPSDCVTGARTKRRAGKDGKLLGGRTPSSSDIPANGPLSGSYATDAYRNWLSGKVDVPDLSLTDLAFGQEFEYLVKRTRQQVMAEKRKARLAAQHAAGDSMENENKDPIVDDPDDGFGAFDDGNDDDDYDDYGHDDSGGGGNIWGDDDYDGGNTGNAGLATVDDAFSGDVDGGLTFEELCRARIQEFAKGAEKYANETQLLQRVRKWQEKLRPLLDEEEQREEFDIHKYGQSIISSIQDELSAGGFDDGGTHAVPFEAIARDRPKYDVPRLFLAALSLCNSGNVTIDEDLNVMLLSSVVEHPMENFLAPSVRENS